ncbi:MAG TPA: riboflavin synthase [Gemmataceae bacterium]|nr:riboflavin synthase [Gemmataceae bacterium]
MFTGLVEALARVESVAPDGSGGCALTLAEAIAAQLQIGESVAVNGACLTVVDRDQSSLRFECGPETLQRTNLGQLKPGDHVNIERSLKFGDRLGGHIVSGHIDGVGRIAKREQQGEFEFVWFSAAPELLVQMVPKGSIAVDGISLTIVDVTRDSFSVMLIPHTLANTTLGFKSVGDSVNLETDVLAKYVERQLNLASRAP